MNNEIKLDKVLTRVGNRYKVERASLVKKEDLIHFFKTAYADQFNAMDYQNEENIIKFWKWANLENPCILKEQFPAWICRDNKNNRVIGHFGVMPVLMKFKDSYYPAVWGRDLIIPPEFRKLGIGPFLIESVLEDTRHKAALFLIAGLNDYVYPIYKKFGFIDLGYIPLYIRMNKLNNLLRLKIHNKAAVRILETLGEALLKIIYMPSSIRRHIYDNNTARFITEVQSFDTSFDKLWEKASPSFSIIIKRDSISLNWRFVHQPYGRYRIFKAETKEDGGLKGYVVLREGQTQGLQIGVISDLFAKADDIYTISSLINFAIQYFEKKPDVDLIRCDILQRNFMRILKNFGFICIRSNSHFMFTNIHQDLDLKFAMDRDNWFINYADSDLDLSGRR